MTVVIRVGEQRVFHAALPGTSAENDGWAERKARVVTHFGVSSSEVFDRYVKDNPEFFRTFALPPEHYSPFGGSVPITVCGTMVGTLAISGLQPEEDHQLAVEALRGQAAFQAEGRRPEPQPSQLDGHVREAAAETYRSLQPGQRAQVWIGGPDKAEPDLLFETPRC